MDFVQILGIVIVLASTAGEIMGVLMISGVIK
jgi:hypothetical protein